jgi:glutamate synthase domain-containing protein 1
MSFIFGGNTGVSYDALKRQQKAAQDLQERSMQGSQSVPEGIRAVAMALMGRQAQKRADAMQQQLIAQLGPEELERLQKARMSDIIGGL